MTRPRNRPIESFGPELMAALVAGGKGPVVIPFPTRKLAKRFQMRIHMLRNLMMKEEHPDWRTAARVRTSLTWKSDTTSDDPATLTLRPNDSEFAEALAAVGVVATPLDEDPLASLSED